MNSDFTCICVCKLLSLVFHFLPYKECKSGESPPPQKKTKKQKKKKKKTKSKVGDLHYKYHVPG